MSYNKITEQMYKEAVDEKRCSWCGETQGELREFQGHHFHEYVGPCCREAVYMADWCVENDKS